jgi:hypothetical protein
MIYAYGKMIKLRRTRHIKRKFLFGGIASFVLIVAAAGFLVLHQPAKADQLYIGPDPQWFGNSERYALENDANVLGAGVTNLPVYVLNQQVSTTPAAHPPTNVTVQVSSFTQGYNGNALSAVNFTYPSGVNCSPTNTGYMNGGAPTFTIPSNCLTYRADINGWSVPGLITATLQNNTGSIQFYLTFVTPGDGSGEFGYSSDNGAQAFAVAPVNRCDPTGSRAGCGAYYNFSIPFGTDCSIKTNQSAQIVIYDADNPSGAAPYGIQPSAFGIVLYDYTSGSPVAVSGTASGGLGNNQTWAYTFTAQPSHKYRLALNSVYTNNLIQFRLPYDSINYGTDCGAYTLNPSISLDRSSAEPGESVQVTPRVDSPNSLDASSGTYWAVSSMTYAAGVAIPTTDSIGSNGGVAAVNPAIPCQYYAVQKATNCVTAQDSNGATWNGTGSFAVGSPSVYTGTGKFLLQSQTLATDYPAGTRVCYALSVYSYNHTTGTSQSWAHSAPTCLVIGKQPKAQVLGGDLKVGNGFAFNGNSGTIPLANVDASTSTKSGTTYGSWIEYGIFATGTITGAASASAYNHGLASATNCQASLLSFALDKQSLACNSSSVIGNYSSTAAIPDVAASFPTSGSESTIASGATFNPATSSLPSGTITAAGDFSISGVGGTIPAGKWYVINAPNANVTVTGNINYTSGAVTSIAAIPQLVIIAKNITVNATVTNVDAWLVAKGTAQGTGGVLTTCEVAPPLSISTCANALTVNGPVMAQTLVLLRTAGSGTGTASGDPAEVFNLRPDAYLWEYNQAASDGHATTVYSQELPPRL